MDPIPARIKAEWFKMITSKIKVQHSIKNLMKMTISTQVEISPEYIIIDMMFMQIKTAVIIQ